MSTDQSVKLRRQALLFLIGVIVISLLGYGLFWYYRSRHYQKTDDAYVMGDHIPITAQISGRVQAIAAETTDLVRVGDPLIQLETVDAEQVVEQAKLILAQRVRQLHSQLVEQRQLAAKVKQQQLLLQQAESDCQRRQLLGKRGAIGQEALQHAQETVQQARVALQIATEALKTNQALLLEVPIAQQPAVLEAASQLQQAWLTLQRTRIISPVTGHVVRRSVQLGAQIAAGAPLMLIAAEAPLWVEANFKETQLKTLRIGQPVEITSDTYGRAVKYFGRISGLYASTGSSLSLLPPQNATGNWIKVVQRLPIKIAFVEPKQLEQHPLVIGASISVVVCTQPVAPSTTHLLNDKKSANSIDITPVKQLIKEIIHDNLPD